MKTKMKKKCVKILTVVSCMITLVTAFVVPVFAEYAPPDGLTEEELEIYNMGYQAGYDDAYQSGYTDGYDDGFEDGWIVGDQEGNIAGYNSGYAVGYTDGETEGYALGYDEGEAYGWQNGFGAGQNDMAETSHTFKEMVFAIFDAPSRLIDSMLNFDIFGINLAGLVKTIITLAVVAVILVVLLKWLL